MRIEMLFKRKHTADCKRVRPTWAIFILLLLPLITTSCSKGFEEVENRRRENFNKNYEAFAKLEQMQREDLNVFSVRKDTTFTYEKIVDKPCPTGKHKNVVYEYCYNVHRRVQALPKDRHDQYRRLLNQANIDQLNYIFDEPKKREVRFYEDGWNDSGYVYMEYPPPKIFNSFKECKPIMPSQSCFVFLRKNWYLYSEQFRLEQKDAK